MEPKLETQEDLFALVKLMPEDGQIEFLKIVQRMQNRKIGPDEATKQVEALLFKHKIIA